MPDRFASLQQRDFRNLWIGGLFSFMGVQMQFFLRGILAWDLTGRKDALGFVYFVFGVALLISTPLGGVATDRLPKRGVMLISQTILVMSAFLMGLAVLTDLVEFWMLLGAAVAQGTAFGFFGPARIAMASDLVGRSNLGNAISLQSLAMNGSRVFAPSFAGALAGWALFGIGGAYIVAAVLSTCSLVLTVLLPNPAAALTGKARPFADIAAGVSYVRSVPAIRNIVLTAFAVLMFAFSYVSFVPALIEGEFGLTETEVGLFTSSSSVGALMAGFWVAGLADSPRAKGIMTLAGTFFGAMVMGLGLAPVFLVAVVIAVMAGAATTTFQTLSNTLALQHADDEYQGRVQSIMQLGFAGFGMTALPLGIVAEQIGLRPTLVIMGGIAATAVLIYGAIEARTVSVPPAERLEEPATVAR
ncbi:MAG: MFS transporter [Acidimicrobiales bacterium]|nr:MFS transporter [Acidimicrobiales bacterium]